MSKYVDINLFKVHVRADDFSDDDAYMQHLIDAAEDNVIQYTNRSADELEEMGGGTFPTPLIQAILLVAGHWYNQREAVASTQMHAIPMGVQSLVRPYRKLVDEGEDEE